MLRSLLSPSHLVTLIKRLIFREEIYSGSSVLTYHGYFIEVESYDLWSFGPSVGLLGLWGLLTFWVSLVTQMVKNPPTMWETRVQFQGQEDPLEKGMATHSSILAWRIPGTEEPGRLQSLGRATVHGVTVESDMTLFSSTCFLTLCIMFLRLSHLAARVNLSFLFVAQQRFIASGPHPTVPFPLAGLWGCFFLLPVVTKAAPSIHIEVFIWVPMCNL